MSLIFNSFCKACCKCKGKVIENVSFEDGKDVITKMDKQMAELGILNLIPSHFPCIFRHSM